MRTYIRRLKARISLNKKQFIAYSILRILVLLTAVRCAFTHNYESLAICVLTLVLFLLPSLFEQLLKIEIPPVFQIIIYLFIFAAEILGEVNKYYTAIPGWDTMLHTINGFLCAAIGFSLFNILNRGSKSMQLSPFYLSLVAFCFSMTVGVVWEFIEFTADQMFFLDMQKDFVVSSFASVTLDESNTQIPVRISEITRTIIETKNGDPVVIEGGYLDIGIIDTMKDLMVNFIGAIVFSVIGYFYEARNKTKSVAKELMIEPLSEESIREYNENIEKKTSSKGMIRSTKE
ncbi:MAG: hypothetical protein ACLVFG_00340 [Lachnospiraceae bacterium]